MYADAICNLKTLSITGLKWLWQLISREDGTIGKVNKTLL
jgi:hypothetical protein